MRWYWKLCILLAVLLPFLGSGCAGPLKATYYRFTPMVVDDDATTDVILEGKVEGSPTAVKLRQQRAVRTYSTIMFYTRLPQVLDHFSITAAAD